MITTSKRWDCMDGIPGREQDGFKRKLPGCRSIPWTARFDSRRTGHSLRIAVAMLFPFQRHARSPVRVAVTGVGIVTALGTGWIANAEGFRTGRTAFRPVQGFDVSRQRTRMAAEVDLPDRLPATRLGARQESRMDRAGRMLLIAAAEAWHQADWPAGMEDLPVVLGTTSGGMALGEEFFRRSSRTPAGRRGQATRVTHYQPQRQVLDLMAAFDFRGPSSIIANACASGSNAIGEAFERIRSGLSHRVLTGGYDALSQLVFAGFDSLQALSPTTCRPFDARRDGLALGEGAAVLALESFEHAKARGATILAEVAGYGAATDRHHLTQPHPAGDAALTTMSEACLQAGIGPSEVGYLNAHGTGTPLNDSAEAAAIHRWAGESVGQLRVSSTKGCVGHLLGAAGAVEAAVCVLALREQWLPPGVGVATPDPACHFPLLSGPASAEFEHVLSNSFGFGGANASLVLRRVR
jgi:3-oxoacyl-[acyl-carrier-protein] synthase II